MKRLYKYILAIFLTFILASCSQDEGLLGLEINNRRGDIQIIGAVMDFDNKIVGTRALGSEESDESLITEMTMFIFDGEKNLVAGQPVVIKNYNKTPDAFMIEIGTGDTGFIGTLNGQRYEYGKNDNSALESCRIYIVANSEHYKKADGTSVYDGIRTLDQLLDQSLPLQGFEMPKSDGKKVGFPMIGTTDDGTTFNLIDASKNTNTVATIPLRKLYSKVVVNISVHADQTNPNYIPMFELDEWRVIDSPTQVKFGADKSGYVSSYENSPDEINNATNQTITHTESEIIDADPNDIISFTFYMPEHLVTPSGTYSYPEDILDNEKQRFKPDVINGKRATYVQIKGTYYDHHGQVKQVAYKLYLGQNNTDDFKVIRNQQLNNYLTIRGVTNSTSAIGPGGELNNISVDHRVEIVHEGLSIAMERETLMDAHFEFRPVDITLSPNSSLTVTVPEDCRGWIAIENGKIRPYFTTDLIRGLTAANGAVLAYTNYTDAAKKFRFWIYVDENPNVYDKTGHGKFTGEGGTYSVSNTESRFGKVQFVYKDGSGTTKTIDYNIEQRNLWRIWNGDWDPATTTPEPTRYYDIEYHEEYLYNYASDDPFGKTTDGMEWGLNGVQLSHIQKAAYVNDTGGILAWIIDLFGSFENMINIAIQNSDATPYYDYYLSRDNPYAGIQPRDYQGYQINKEIIDTLTGLYNNSGTSNEIKKAVNLKVELDEDPISAIAYCYNKNKRGSGGYVDMNNDFHWYLPAIDEIELITYYGYGDFDVFQNKLYWSCQPAAENNDILVSYSGSTGTGTYKSDDVDRARATKINMIDNSPVNVSSGANGLFRRLNVSGSGWPWDISWSYAENEINENVSWGNHPGNLPRSGSTAAINRVRCVYRSGAMSQ